MQNVSFIMAVYSEGKTLEQSIKSILNQKFDGKKEIIIVDDVSIDNSYEIALKLASKYKEIRVIRNTKNMGVGISRNIGAKKAKYNIICMWVGDYIADDIYWTKKMLDALTSNENIAIAETRLKIPKYILKEYNFLNKLSLLYYFRNPNKIWGISPLMFRKKAFIEVGGYDTTTFRTAGEDTDLDLRLKKLNYKVAYADKTKTILLHLHGTHNPSIKSLLIHKALPVGGEAAGVLFRRYFYLENKFWNPIISTILYGGLLIPYFRILSASLLILILSYYTFLVAIKLKDIKAIIIAPFFKIAKDLFVIVGFWKGFITGKQTFK